MKGVFFRIRKRRERITLPLPPLKNILIRPPEVYLSGFVLPWIKELKRIYTCIGIIDESEIDTYESMFERLSIYDKKKKLPQHDAFINLRKEDILSEAPVRIGIFPSVFHNLEIRGGDFPSILAFIGKLLGIVFRYKRVKKEEKKSFMIEDPEIRKILENYPPHPKKLIMDLNPYLSSVYLSSTPFILIAPSHAWIPLKRDGMEVVRYKNIKEIKRWAEEFFSS